MLITQNTASALETGPPHHSSRFCPTKTIKANPSTCLCLHWVSGYSLWWLPAFRATCTFYGQWWLTQLLNHLPVNICSFFGLSGFRNIPQLLTPGNWETRSSSSELMDLTSLLWSTVPSSAYLLSILSSILTFAGCILYTCQHYNGCYGDQNKQYTVPVWEVHTFPNEEGAS